MKVRLYCELHITCEAGQIDWESFKVGCELRGWRASKFDEDLVDNYSGKWFMSARCVDTDDIQPMLKQALAGLHLAGVTVLRWKAEDTLLDSKHGDTLA